MCAVAACRPPIVPPMGCLFSFFFLGSTQVVRQKRKEYLTPRAPSAPVSFAVFHLLISFRPAQLLTGEAERECVLELSRCRWACARDAVRCGVCSVYVTATRDHPLVLTTKPLSKTEYLSRRRTLSVFVFPPLCCLFFAGMTLENPAILQR